LYSRWFKYNFLISAISCVILISCGTNVPVEIDEIITKAGANGDELRSAIHHYRHSGDSLKLKALYYLIRSMEYKNSFYGDILHKFEPFFDNPTGDHDGEWNKYVEKHGAPNSWELSVIPDYELITADFLIKNIDLAFYAWHNFPWCKDISFEGFCEYILPYRCGNEHLTNNWRETLIERYRWLPDSVKHDSTMINAYTFIYNDIHNWLITEFEEYPFNLSLEQILKFKDGRCHDECNLFLYVCRAMGITIVKEMLPGWGKRKMANHGWIILLDENNNRLVMHNNELHPINAVPVNASYFVLDSIGKRYIPSQYQVMETKGITKIFRVYNKYWPEALAFINKQQEEIPEFFSNPCLKDVTNEYLPIENITIKGIKANRKYAYLCVFDCYNWRAHDWAEISGDSAVFQNIGFDAVYLPAIFINREYIPVSNPFIIDIKGNMKVLSPGSDYIETLRLYRKYPLFANIVNYANAMVGGRFEAANDPDFSDAVTIYTVDHTPLFIQEFTTQTGNIQYLRFLAPENKQAQLAELSVEADKGNGFVPLQYTTVSDTPVSYTYAKNVTDGNYVSYFLSKNNNGWIGLDFGEQVKAKQLRIKYCPRNDDNFITPGFTYELRYWDNKWVTSDIKKAENYWIEFNKVPKNTLYLIHCLNGGTEERIFIVKKDGKIEWY